MKKLVKIREKVKSILKDIKGAYNKIQEIKTFITADTTKKAYHYGKKIIIKLLRHILPKKIRGDIEFGFERPDMTGRVLGYIAMTFGTFNINPKHIAIHPDFENQVFRGNIKMKGHFLFGKTIYLILRLYCNKEINEIIKKFS